MSESNLDLLKKLALRKLQLGLPSESSLNQPDSSTHLPCRDMDPALSRARVRLDEIKQEQTRLNRSKQVLSRELRQILKDHPSLRTK